MEVKLQKSGLNKTEINSSKNSKKTERSELLTGFSWQGHKDLNPEPTVLEMLIQIIQMI